MNEMKWQPIETAPKDGTVVDLYSEGIGRTVYAAFEYGEWREWVACDGEWRKAEVEEPPTHWMPLPPPPEDI